MEAPTGKHIARARNLQDPGFMIGHPKIERMLTVSTLLGACALLNAASTFGLDRARFPEHRILTVQSPPSEAARPNAPIGSIFTSDAEIEERVRNALVWSPMVDATRIGVDVRRGSVTLSGTVDTPAEAGAAERITRRTGVRTVDNRLRVAR